MSRNFPARTFPSRSFPSRSFPERGQPSGGGGGGGGAPVISSIVETIAQTSVDVAWTTDILADGQLEWGADASYGKLTTRNATPLTAHRETISGLAYTTPTFAHVQSKARLIGGSGAMSIVLTLDQPLTVGNLAVLGIGINSAATIATVTDNATGGTNSYTLAAGPRTQSFRKAWQYQTLVVRPGATQITVTFSTSGACGLYLDEFSGVKAAGYVGATSTGGAETGTALAVASFAPVAGSLVVASIFADAVITAGSGYTKGADDGLIGANIYRLTSTTSETASATQAASSIWAEVAVAYVVADPFGQSIHYRIRTASQTGVLTLGSDRTATTSPPADVTPPVISNVAAGTPGSNGVTITWTTNEASTSRVQYRVVGQTSWTQGALDSTLVNSHTRTLAGLVSGTDYEYQVLSADAAGNLATGNTGTFTTATGNGSLTQMSLTDVSGGVLDASRIYPLYNSILVELRYSGDTDNNSTVAVEFKKSADPTWRSGFALWQTVNGTDKAFYGMILNGIHVDGSNDLLANTSYDLRLTVSDGAETAVVTATASTRADTHAGETPPAAFTPTHYVDPVNGADTNNGTTAGTPWKTMSKVVSAINATSTDMTIKLKAGYYSMLGVATITNPNNRAIVLYGENVPVRWNPSTQGMDLQNVGQQTVLDFGFVTGPTGSTDAPQTAGWTQVTPDGDPSHPLYSRAVPSGSYNGIQKLGYASTRAAVPQHIPRWATQSAWTTPSGFASVVWTNQTQNYGFLLDESVSPNVIYLKMPPQIDVSPNTLYMTGSVGTAPLVSLSARNIRLCGLVMKCGYYGVYADPNCHDMMIDHCSIENSWSFVGLFGGQPGTYAQHPLIQYNRFEGSNHVSEDLVNFPPISWDFIKGSVILANGSLAGNRIGADSAETVAIFLRGGHQHGTFRYNTVDGPFNGVGCYSASFNKYSAFNWELHHNIIKNIGDDCFEPEQSVIGWAIYANYLHSIFDCLSTGPVDYGPVYFYRNVCHDLRVDFEKIRSGGGLGFKYSGSAFPPSRVYVVNNTIWSGRNLVAGGSQAAGGSGGGERFYVRNNLVRASNYAFNSPGAGRWDENYNDWSTTDPTRGIKFGAGYTTIAAYRAASGQGANSNVSWDFHDLPDAQLADPTNSLIAPLPEYRGLGIGTTVPNINDQPSQRIGSVPSMGAYEHGWTFPSWVGGSGTTLPSGTWLLASPVTVGTSLHPLIVVVMTETGGTRHVTGVDLGGTPLAMLSSTSGAGKTISIWWLAAPTTGQDLHATLDATATIEETHYIVYGAKQTTPFTTVATDTATGTAPSVSVDCAGLNGVGIVEALAYNAVSPSVSDLPVEGRYQRRYSAPGAVTVWNAEKLAVADPQSMSWGLASSTPYLYIAVGVKPFGS